MKPPTTRSLFSILDGAYALGLILLIPLANEYSDSRGSILGFGPVALTMMLFVGQFLVTGREQAAMAAGRPTGAKASHLWGGMLAVYIVFALLDAGINSALGGGSLP